MSKIYSYLSNLKRFVWYNLLRLPSDYFFKRWQKANPGADFSAYYVDRELRNLRIKQAHPTLGHQLKKGKFKASGKKGIFRLMIEDGLQPQHVCIDYGCGSLRVGQHLIRYLHPGNYYGLDVTDAFFELGRQAIGPDVLLTQQAHLQLINPETLVAVRARQPDYVFSVGVMLHVPPNRLRDYFHHLLSLCKPSTLLYIALTSYQENIQLNELSFAYKRQFIQEELLQLNPNLRIEFLMNKEKEEVVRVNTITLTRSIMRITTVSS